MISLLKESYELTSDYSDFENKDIFLESTSSMVFDRVNKVAYIGVSPRTDKELANNGVKIIHLKWSYSKPPVMLENLFIILMYLCTLALK